jgi:hypothetical protein
MEGKKCPSFVVAIFVDHAFISAGTAHMPWWAGKEEVRKYLRKINENEKVRASSYIAPVDILTFLGGPQLYAVPARSVSRLSCVSL